jgi:Flp pilus assembly protein TadB
MMLALLCGAGVGAGILLIVRGLYPPRPSLANALAQLRTVPEAVPLVVRDADGGFADGGFAARFGRPLADALGRGKTGWLIPPRVRRDLAVLDRSPERHLAEKVSLALVGLLFAPALAGLLLLGGTHLPVAVPLWGSLIFMVVGFVVPDLGIHADANRRRRDFRHALSSFLDLVVVALAGGGGVETALADAASIGSGWTFSYLRRALDEARLSRETPWAVLGRLGAQLGVTELSELAASVSLAGTEGAKVRASLAAKAASMRTHELSEAETEDQAATERMSLPVVLLLAGFLLFIGFPAVDRVLTGLG